MDNIPSSDNMNKLSGQPQDSTQMIMAFVATYLKEKRISDEKADEQYYKLENKRLEAQRQTEKYNKLYGGILVIVSLSIYSLLMWYGKASEGFGILVTAIVTSSMGGIFKSLISLKEDTDDDKE